MNSTSVLITGAGGFLGTHLVKHLQRNDIFDLHQVVRRGAANFSNTIVCEDLRVGFEWPLDHVDVVIHLAGLAHKQKSASKDDLEDFRSINTFATINLAKQAALSGVRRFIFLSSIGVYGDATSAPLTSHVRACPIEPYAVSKYEAELLLLELSKETGMEVVIIRPPLIYGPHAPGNFRKLVKLSCLGLPLPFSCVINRRSFIGVDNLCSLIEVCIFHLRATQKPILPADREVVSTVDLIRCISDASKVKARLIPVPVGILKLLFFLVGKRAMYQKLFGDLEIYTQEAYDLLDWAPCKTFVAGIHDAILYSESVE
ncbi:NAD-dependent epimerase/dehydratase family protein [Pseudomonas sp. EL_65y_Pfl2_R95]|uniref:NAD-dependent epimerase/dehydratase family protein n=1 Tax=Pseudomonas sp. EL_65y_Pfl2_R95 TaxID=3088698 RepID=UPI0030D8349F